MSVGVGAELGRLRLFLSSYSPAFAIVAVRWDGWLLRSICAAIAAASALDTLLLVRRAGQVQQIQWLPVQAIDNIGSEVGAYLASYLLPLLTAPNPTSRDLVTYGLFLALSAIIYVQSDLMRVNPVLFIAGYRVLKVSTDRPQPDYLLARGDLSVGDWIGTAQMAGVLLLRGRRDGSQDG